MSPGRWSFSARSKTKRGEEAMSQEPKAGMEVSSDDKLWAALAYVFSPLVPIIILLMEDKKNRPYIKAHNMQALVWGLLVYVIGGITTAFVIGLCLLPLGLLVELYWARSEEHTSELQS